MGNYSDAKSSIRCFSKASVSLFGIIGIGFSKTSSRKLHRNLHHRKYDKAVLACFRSVQIKACEKIPQGESSLAKFLKNLLFWTFWPAKSSKTTLFEKIHQDLDGSSPNVLVCLYRSSPRWRASTDWSLQPLNLMFLRNLRISTS